MSMFIFDNRSDRFKWRTQWNESSIFELGQVIRSAEPQGAILIFMNDPYDGVGQVRVGFRAIMTDHVAVREMEQPFAITANPKRTVARLAKGADITRQTVVGMPIDELVFAKQAQTATPGTDPHIAGLALQHRCGLSFRQTVGLAITPI